MSANPISKLVAEAAEKNAAPIPADMEHVSIERLDGGRSFGYHVNGSLAWWRDDDPRGVPLTAQPLYVRKAV